MSRCLLFCTAQMPPDRIKQLITQILAFENNEPWQNCISLVRDPSQRDFDDPTRASSIVPFKTGFLDYSIDGLGHFVKKRMPRPRGQLSHDIFADLDARSLNEDTLLLARWHERFSDHGIENDDYSDEQKLWEGWIVRRIRFRHISSLLAIIEEEQLAEDVWRDGQSAVVDGNGVFSLPTGNTHPGFSYGGDRDVLPREKRL